MEAGGAAERRGLVDEPHEVILRGLLLRRAAAEIAARPHARADTPDGQSCFGGGGFHFRRVDVFERHASRVANVAIGMREMRPEERDRRDGIGPRSMKFLDLVPQRSQFGSGHVLAIDRRHRFRP